MNLSRRSILLGASLAATPIPAWARSFSAGAFTHGVASGDPSKHAVILWTRFAPAASGEARIGWEISEHEDFSRVARRGALTQSAVNDYCVKVDARGLQPGRRYFYRFLSASGPSATGLTRTAPERAESLNAAFFSCSNMPWGYFHAYGDAAAREEVELCLHLGDYIYEMQRGAYPSANEAVSGRVIEPAGETVTLADYYARYGSYHLDPDLQELRRLKPMSTVWDDHELTNDTWKDGAQNHQPGTEGTWADRFAAASKAYFDWMPIRAPQRNSSRIYRSLDWGDLARVVLLDTRKIGRDQQLNYERDLMPLVRGGAPMAQAAAHFKREKLDNPNRSLLGAEQEQWLAATLAASKARGQTWQVIAQQIVMSPMIAPEGISRLLPANAAPTNWFAQAEQLRAYNLPWNTDAWDGYPPARERFKAALTANAVNALVLGGDSHNTWVYNAPAAGGSRLAAIEFAGGSVSSPGFERSLTNAQPGDRERLIRSANPDLVFGDFTNRGYGAFKLTRERCEAEWRAVGDIRVRERGAVRVTKFTSSASTASGPGAWSVTA